MRSAIDPDDQRRRDGRERHLEADVDVLRDHDAVGECLGVAVGCDAGQEGLREAADEGVERGAFGERHAVAVEHPDDADDAHACRTPASASTACSWCAPGRRRTGRGPARSSAGRARTPSASTRCRPCWASACGACAKAGAAISAIANAATTTAAIRRKVLSFMSSASIVCGVSVGRWQAVRSRCRRSRPCGRGPRARSGRRRSCRLRSVPSGLHGRWPPRPCPRRPRERRLRS